MNTPAFPTQIFYEEKLVDCLDGLTKRELFAAMAMQALIKDCICEMAADEAVKYADALIGRLAEF